MPLGDFQEGPKGRLRVRTYGEGRSLTLSRQASRFLSAGENSSANHLGGKEWELGVYIEIVIGAQGYYL